MEMWLSITFSVLFCANVVYVYGISTKNDNSTIFAYYKCSEGWYYSLDLNQCYYISSNNLAFKDALATCKGLFSQLVSVFSEEEYFIVSAHIQEQPFAGDTPAWIGLQVDGGNHLYWPDRSFANYTHWINGSTSLTFYTNTCYAWYSAPANNGWWVYDCQAALPFICKRSSYLNLVNITANSGSISSPNYPLPYFSNSVTNYYITVDPGYFIDLSFNVVALDANSVIKVYDGPDANSRILETIRKGSHRNMIESNSNQIAIEFVASAESGGNYIGWSASFNASVPITTSGNFSSPNLPSDYNDNENIYYRIQAPENFTILFSFWYFYSEGGRDILYISSSCYEIFWWGLYQPFNFSIPCSDATFHWQTDNDGVTQKGFNMTWIATPLF